MSPRVRNIGGLGSRKPIPAFVWIPPKFTAISKVEIEDSDSNTTDVTDFIIEGELTDGITETIGNFNFKVDNSNQVYNGVFSLYDKINIYLDYGTAATTLKFVGLLERVSSSNYNIILSGRSSAIRTVGKMVTYSAESKLRSIVLTEIIEKYFSGVITTNNIEEDTVLVTVNYFEVPFWEVVEDLCKAGGRDAYIDPSFDFHYFISGSRENTTEAVVHTSNLIETGDFSPDLTSIANRVRVYGKETNGIPLIATANDVTSQTNLSGDIKELIINDSSITTVEQAQVRADFELANNKDPPTIGTIKSLGLPTLSPGEKVRISDPLNGLEPGTYQIQKFTHMFSNDEPFQTILTVQKERTTIPNILKKRIKFETESSDNPNPREMDYTILYDFNVDSGTHLNTLITDGFLRLSLGGSAPGTWISGLTEIESNITEIEARISGSNLSLTQIFFSVDGGLTFKQIYGSGTPAESPVTPGRKIVIKVIINSDNTEIDTIGLLYKL